MKTQNTDEGQQKLQAVDMDIGEIELPKIDVNPFVGKRAKIATAETCTGGQYGNYVLRVQTDVVHTVTGGKKPIELRGSIIFGLQEDAEGRIGWGAGTKLAQFLQKMKVKSPKELIGKEVILQKQTVKSGADFLTITV